MLALFALLQSPAQAAAPIDDEGCRANVLPANDDGSSSNVQLPFELDFYGHRYQSLWVNNNGNVTFDRPLSTYVPFDLSRTSQVIIAPFFGDVDTRGDLGQVTYGNATYRGRTAFCVTWKDVGYYNVGGDRRNTFQLLLVEQPSGFDVVFRYDRIEWELGQASGGASAHAGFSNGDPDRSLELAGSGQRGAFLDGGPLSLAARSFNSTEAGEFVFPIRNGCTSNDPRNVPAGFGCASNWWEWPDTDDDGLPDKWETDGVWVNDRYVDLAAAGARVGRTDAFVYVDTVRGERWNARIQGMIVRAFSTAPVPGGIAVHFVEHRGVLDRSQVPDRVEATRAFFGAVKSAAPNQGGSSFNASGWARSASTPQLAKYVCACPNHVDGLGTGGEAAGILADDLVVTMDEPTWREEMRREAGTPAITSGTLRSYLDDRINAITAMHELGHLYGLRHHGAEDDPAGDHDYRSIMSYAYNAAGVPSASGQGTVWRIDFSRERAVNLDWRLRARDPQNPAGALTLVVGSNGERGDFYTVADDFTEPEASVGSEAPIQELVALSGAGAEIRSYLEQLDEGDIETFPGELDATTTSLAPVSSRVFGGSFTLRASVVRAAGGQPQGEVAFYERVNDRDVPLGRAALVDGAARLAGVRLHAGSHNVFAVYEGDAASDGSVSPTILVVIAPRSVTVTPSGERVYGETATRFTPSATTPDDVALTGSLDCARIGGGRAVGDPLAAGSYRLVGSSCSGVSLTGSAASDYRVTYRNGDLVVRKAPNTVTTSSTSRAVSLLQLAVTYTTTVRSAVTGRPIAGVPVRVQPSGRPASAACDAVTDRHGVATCRGDLLSASPDGGFTASVPERANYLAGSAQGSTPLV
ncbi:Ig-like domain repeat protein [Nocardioides sp. TRM66260-LWL]|uniref:nidogen-like domain-containing protein n=1 Tax=Nocardioides sp. TRM66260-LWL TaxID=2874478 RepID=UPI001CC48AEF|nr:nidogen-like domain-containing protein [Nocardioides sp. TRM66260-LWL]MBZ5734068.1 Ig-like domain repeat protein [Nocardioides sp. TRM66260-LWL]